MRDAGASEARGRVPTSRVGGHVEEGHGRGTRRRAGRSRSQARAHGEVGLALDSIGGLTWLDWSILILVALFAVRGLLRGSVVQILGLLGVLLGLWAAGWIARWVGDLWTGARPAVVFWALRWLVAGLGGLAVASLFGSVGEHLGAAVRSGPAGWLDRLGGALVGAALGVTVAAFTLMVALQDPIAAHVEPGFRSSRVSAHVLHGAALATSLSDRWFPGSDWLRERFERAAARAGGAPAI